MKFHLHTHTHSGFGDLKTSKFEVGIKLTKKLQILGNYKLNGQVLILPIAGHGFSNLTFGMCTFISYVIFYSILRKVLLRIFFNIVYSFVLIFFSLQKMFTLLLKCFQKVRYERAKNMQISKE